MVKIEDQKPFVITIAGSINGMPIAILAGVELGTCDDDAFHKAVLRFPPYRYIVLPPLPWEEVNSEIRMGALEADRLGIFA